MSTERGPQKIDALTEAQKIVDKLKQHQIALPDGKLVPAQGKMNNRILRSLVAAFEESRPDVATEELIAPDISSGIPRKEAQTSLYNSIYKLKTRTLPGSNWNIITFVDKRGKRSARGRYVLVNETSSKTTENPSMETLILTDGKTIIRLRPRPKAMLQRIIDSEDKGVTSEELQQSHIDAGKNSKTAKNNVHDDLISIRAALNNKPFEIVNLTSQADSRRGKGGRYVFKPNSTIIDNPKQNGTLVIPEGGETTIFAANGDANSVTQSPPEDPQEKNSSPWREWDSHGNTPLRPEKPKKRINELKTKTPEGILGVKTTVQVLSSLLEGSLTQSTKDTKTLLAKIIHGNPSDFGRMKLDTLFNETSPSRLNRFFRVNFTAIVDDCWNKEITPDTPKEETQIIEIVNKLKERSYDKTRAVQEVFGHFGIKIPAEYVV